MTGVIVPPEIKKRLEKRIVFKLDKLVHLEKPRVRTAFYASDFGRADLDLYFAWKGEKKTNAALWNETLKWGAGRGVEDQMLRILKDSGVVPEEYDQKKHGRVDMERAGITIHGYIDAAMGLGPKATPIEIKSINNKNFVAIKKYRDGNPPENYVGQLAIYMDARDLDKGYLFAASVDGLSVFLFECKRLRDGRFRCGKTIVDLDEFYARLHFLKTENIDKNILPDIWQYVYKYPVQEINWSTISVSDISKARTGKKVLGDYQISWSDWKNKIVKLQGQKLGYSNKELKFILKATKGYSSKNGTGRKKASHKNEPRSKKKVA